jgi:hypothetical protein
MWVVGRKGDEWEQTRNEKMLRLQLCAFVRRHIYDQTAPQNSHLVSLPQKLRPKNNWNVPVAETISSGNFAQMNTSFCLNNHLILQASWCGFLGKSLGADVAVVAQSSCRICCHAVRHPLPFC